MAFLHTIRIKGIGIPFELKRNARSKSIRISIFQDGRVLVSAPPRLKEKDVLKFVSAKAPWILEKLGGNALPQSSQASPFCSTPDLEDGTEILYLGSPHLLRITFAPPSSARARVELQKDIFYLTVPPGYTALALLTQWFRTQARDIFTEKTHYWSKILGLAPTAIHIRTQKTRWGSCNPKTGTLNFNWKILIAPDEIIDYLVVHELCHLRIPNHSRDFWQLVGAILPDYQAHKTWLKQYGSELELKEWRERNATNQACNIGE